ncbi:MAG: hypothetical protein P8172_14835 [Gammaproteobacteria bacterium]
MNTGAGFSYAQARIQARHGARPDGTDWSRLESCESTHAYLEAARSGIFADWAEGLSADQGIHELEKALSDCWRHYLARVTDWAPESWRPALAWCDGLTSLPATAHVVRGGETWAWLDDEAEGAPALEDWRAAWHERMPAMDGRSELGITALESAVDAWMDANRDTASASASRAVQLREALEKRVTTVFRRHALEPAAVFAHLVLTALDLQRFRGGLLRRQALTGTVVGGQGAS